MFREVELAMSGTLAGLRLLVRLPSKWVLKGSSLVTVRGSHEITQHFLSCGLSNSNG